MTEGLKRERTVLERELERQVKVLADRLALALMPHSELMQAVVMLDSRDADRDMLRDDPGYDLWKRAVRRMLVDERRRALIKEKAA
jgi:hypothetical protein